jgi:DNA repair protein RecO (recombination protein O)
MLYKTKGITLNYIRFKESSIIAKIYTEQFGIQSYIVNGVRSTNKKTNKIALYQPLTLVDLVVYHKENKPDTLNRISEIRCNFPYQSIPFDIIKTTIGLFMTEVLTKTLLEEEQNTALFEFLEQQLQAFDHQQEQIEYFPLQFLTQFSFLLGFGLESVKDLEDELSVNAYPLLLDDAQKQAIEHWLHGSSFTPLSQKLTKSQRLTLLDMLLYFYKVHIINFGDTKSTDILHTIFS